MPFEDMSVEKTPGTFLRVHVRTNDFQHLTNV